MNLLMLYHALRKISSFREKALKVYDGAVAYCEKKLKMHAKKKEIAMVLAPSPCGSARRRVPKATWFEQVLSVKSQKTSLR